LDHWNTSRVTNMTGMFSNASEFEQDLSMWNVGNVRNTIVANMFFRTRMSATPQFWPHIAENLPPTTPMPTPLVPPLFNPGFGMVPSQPPVPPPLSEEQRRIAEELRERHKKAKEQPQGRPSSPDKNEFPFCCVCGEELNNVEGPDGYIKFNDDRPTSKHYKDVIRVCGHRAKHFMHRGCAIQWQNAPQVNITAQMGFNQYSNIVSQQKTSKCPICTRNMENLECAEKVDNDEILRVTHNDDTSPNKKKSPNQKAGKRGIIQTKKQRKSGGQTRKQRKCVQSKKQRKNGKNKQETRKNQ